MEYQRGASFRFSTFLSGNHPIPRKKSSLLKISLLLPRLSFCLPVHHHSSPSTPQVPTSPLARVASTFPVLLSLTLPLLPALSESQRLLHLPQHSPLSSPLPQDTSPHSSSSGYIPQHSSPSLFFLRTQPPALVSLTPLPQDTSPSLLFLGTHPPALLSLHEVLVGESPLHLSRGRLRRLGEQLSGSGWVRLQAGSPRLQHLGSSAL